MSGREIKFRVWLKTCKRIEKVLKISYGEPTLVWHESGLNTINDVELLQLTGLKYQTGEEMLEGDVVNIVTADGWIGRGQIFWDDEEGSFYHGFQEVFDGKLSEYHRPPKRMWKYLKKIGNIYENPELL